MNDMLEIVRLFTKTLTFKSILLEMNEIMPQRKRLIKSKILFFFFFQYIVSVLGIQKRILMKIQIYNVECY